jgi:tetratricopeptide (TPR) repeat protein
LEAYDAYSQALAFSQNPDLTLDPGPHLKAHFEKVMFDIEKATRTFKYSPDPVLFLNRGYALAKMGRFEDSIPDYDQCLKYLDSKDCNYDANERLKYELKCRYRRAESLRRVDRYPACLSDLERLMIITDPSSSPSLNLRFRTRNSIPMNFTAVPVTLKKP